MPNTSGLKVRMTLDIDIGSKAVIRIIGRLDHLFWIIKRGDGCQWPKDLFTVGSCCRSIIGSSG